MNLIVTNFILEESHGFVLVTLYVEENVAVAGLLSIVVEQTDGLEHLWSLKQILVWQIITKI